MITIHDCFVVHLMLVTTLNLSVYTGSKQYSMTDCNVGHYLATTAHNAIMFATIS